MVLVVRDGGFCVHLIEPCLCGLQGSATILDKLLPRRVESIEEACDRYVQEMEVRQQHTTPPIHIR